jgi:hypothetical protein
MPRLCASFPPAGRFPDLPVPLSNYNLHSTTMTFHNNQWFLERIVLKWLWDDRVWSSWSCDCQDFGLLPFVKLPFLRPTTTSILHPTRILWDRPIDVVVSQYWWDGQASDKWLVWLLQRLWISSRLSNFPLAHPLTTSILQWPMVLGGRSIDPTVSKCSW